MSVPIKKIPIGGLTLDVDPLRHKNIQLAYCKNMTTNNHKNGDDFFGLEGYNALGLTSSDGNKLIGHSGVNFPSGTNTCIGAHEAKVLNELYVFVHNSNNNHFIYRIKGNTSGADPVLEIVYSNANLNFQLTPIYFISEGRCHLRIITYTDKATGVPFTRKYLIFTDNFNPQRFISVEDSIVTNSYSTSYFNSNYPIYSREDLINLGVANPYGCPTVTAVARDTGDPVDMNAQNQMTFKTWRFRIKNIDVFQRESEHGHISSPYITIVGGGCIANSNGLPRCVDIVFDAGDPLVDKIAIEFATCGGNGLVTDTDWFEYEVLDKYDNTDITKKWYERSINPNITYNATTNKITYRFCADKECKPIDPQETLRNENPLPITSSSLFPLDRRIGLANNVRGFDPIDPHELQKVEYTVTPPVQGPCDAENLRTIVVYMQMVSPFNNFEVQYLRWLSGKAVFGIAPCGGPNEKNNPISYDQYVPDGYEGFIGYLAGTPHKVLSKQVQHFPGTNPAVDAYLGVGNNAVFCFQKFEFKVPPGKYMFRIANHQADINGDYQKTSTYIIGKSQFDAGGSQNLTAKDVKELEIDVCSGDHLSDDITSEYLVLWDLTRKGVSCLVNNASTLVDGYLYEDNTSFIPLENNPCFNLANGTKINCDFTDHNGFFFGASKAKHMKMNMLINDCTNIISVDSQEAIDNFNAGGHKRHDVLFSHASPSQYPDKGRIYIKGKITFCDLPTVGISGVLVVRTQGGFAYTDNNGEYTIIAHTRSGAMAAIRDHLIFSQKGVCTPVSCDDECVVCFPNIDFALPACDNIKGRHVTIDPFSAGLKGVNKKGPQNGGRYGIGIVGHDWMGRSSFVWHTEQHYVDMPKLIDTKVFDFSKIGFDITGVVFPSWVKYITFCITENLAWDDFITWSVDKMEKVDAAGNINNATPTQMKIYYGSLGQFNFQNNFATNTNWEFQTSGGTTEVSRLGDVVEFIMNGDNQWFPKYISALVRYDQLGSYILIDYDADLDGLLPGAMIKIIRPKQCVNKNIYYELCPVIKVDPTTHLAAVVTGTLDYFDAYFLERQTPIPNGTNPVTVSVQSHTYLFEHYSPSDFWGDHCHTKGRQFVLNPLERRKLLGTEIALSAVEVNKADYNGLSYFSELLVKTFDDQEWGNIVSVLPELNVLLCICEYDNFVVGYNDNAIRINAEGTATVGSAAGAFGEPQRKIGGNYGCQFADINTIKKLNGVAIFLDRSRHALLFHNYSDCADVSVETENRGGYKSHLTRKIDALIGRALGGTPATSYFVAGIDPKTEEYYLTDWWNNINNDSRFINVLSAASPTDHETLVVEVPTGVLKGFACFTPNYYGTLEGYEKTFLTFKGAEPYMHHGQFNDNTPFCNYFGYQDNKIFAVVFNTGSEKVKRFLYNEVYCNQHKFIADSMISDIGQVSRIKASWWIRGEFYWSAHFMGNFLTIFDPSQAATLNPRVVTEGDIMSGRALTVYYKDTDADKGKYCSVSAVVAYVEPVKSAD